MPSLTIQGHRGIFSKKRKSLCRNNDFVIPKAGIPPGKSDASGQNRSLLQHQGVRPDAARCVRFPRWNSSFSCTNEIYIITLFPFFFFVIFIAKGLAELIYDRGGAMQGQAVFMFHGSAARPNSPENGGN